MYVINLGYLKNKSLYFIKFFDSNIKKSNKILVELNIIAII